MRVRRPGAWPTGKLYTVILWHEQGQYNYQYTCILLRQEPGAVHTFGPGSSLGDNILHKHGTYLRFDIQYRIYLRHFY